MSKTTNFAQKWSQIRFFFVKLETIWNLDTMVEKKSHFYWVICNFELYFNFHSPVSSPASLPYHARMNFKLIFLLFTFTPKHSHISIFHFTARYLCTTTNYPPCTSYYFYLALLINAAVQVSLILYMKWLYWTPYNLWHRLTLRKFLNTMGATKDASTMYICDNMSKIWFNPRTQV